MPPSLASEVDGFLKTVERSGLMDRSQLQAALRSAGPEQRTDPQSIADYLVKKGLLSRFQASKLIKGMFVGLVLGPYQILAPIGRGGMGTVYLARDTRNQQLVAVKVLPPKRAREEERLVARFQREMQLCQKVAHPHLTRTHEVGVCQGVYYIAMEYIPGQSLYRLVAAGGPLDVPRAARLFAEVAEGLQHAHGQGLVHRDLKPSNILITPNDHAKVLDLGLALMVDEGPVDRAVVGGEGYVVGTMDYLAPEQADDCSKVDPRSDIYSLGCTLYYALVGRPPFPGGTAMDKIKRHRAEEPVPVPQLNPRVPPGFIGLLRRMMAKLPEQRFASASELRRALLEWADFDEVLPLDQEDDQGYQLAVADLEAAEPALEVLQEEIVQPPRRGGRRPSSSDLARSIHAEEGDDGEEGANRPAWQRYVLPATLAAIVLMGLSCLGLVGVVWLLLKR